ncbi:MAG: hypothetical protein A3C07_02075 [Candidatus Sungbacteria bacterium RIFCSPHIGHO2_02_FULL_47_11]|uniref:Recombination protein RecR n=1 Tax=Candidatus Sungbacteria bacterium RIFCSPHIGHO2_02_FULL_47_11 TaxID=1802270 RepID=A0A1G2KQX3_9BACT|nr:MAG: hypothetical protein A3C07_02075 [Candidatus Sungbacteria bacterium RIFCSPHIGHO2_02_FULL_47_11]
MKNGTAREFAETLRELEKIGFCGLCYRSVEKSGSVLCRICADKKRDHAVIAVVEKESDMQNLEKMEAYRGLYHVLGGVVSPLDSESTKGLHLKELYKRVENLLNPIRDNPPQAAGAAPAAARSVRASSNGGTISNGARKCEVILATNTTTEGDTTALYIERILAPLAEKHAGLKISRLGRGLSLGSELEYADEVTLKNALTNRR